MTHNHDFRSMAYFIENNYNKRAIYYSAVDNIFDNILNYMTALKLDLKYDRKLKLITSNNTNSTIEVLKLAPTISGHKCTSTIIDECND